MSAAGRELRRRTSSAERRLSMQQAQNVYQPTSARNRYWDFFPWAVPLFIVACGLIVWGWGEMRDDAADWARGNQTAEFNAVVRRWETVVRPEWEKVQTIQLHDWFPGQDPLEGIVLERNESEEPRGTRLVSGEGLLPYAPLRYTYAGKVPLSKEGGLRPWRDVTADLRFTTSRQSIHRPLASNLVLTGSDVTRTSNWKVCQYQRKGSLDPKGICTVYKRLSQMCFKLHLSPSQDGGPPTWGPPPGEEVQGCDPEGTQLSTAYRVVPGPRYQPNPPGPPRGAELDSVSLVARADGDPYLAAMKIAGKQHRFAPSRGERITTARLLLGFGVALGALLLALSVCWCTRSVCFDDAPPVRRVVEHAYVDRAAEPARGGSSSRLHKYRRVPQSDAPDGGGVVVEMRGHPAL